MRANPGRAFWRAAAGTAAIEFAFLAVPFMALAFAVFEFGRACWTLEALQESAVQGARCIGVQSSSCYSSDSYSASATTRYVQGVAGGWGITVPTANIVPVQSTTCGTVAGFAQVQITYTFSTVVGQLIPALTNRMLTATSCFPDNP
ncbi:MAG TPA: TadE/TadG family type IV pilus assembly protein [Rhizomicrobium sp.]|jgi:Flp pilus assembly protein TadG